MRVPVKPNVSPRPRGLTTGSIKTINTNKFSIFNWIPWSRHGMTEVNKNRRVL
ncbi:MAG: proline/betaine transporter [Rickettsia conorii subsp. raoultii]